MYIDEIVNKIADANPVAGKKLRKNLLRFSDEHRSRSQVFFEEYVEYLKSINKTIDFSVDCYLKMTGDMFFERVKFLESGKYSKSSYKEVEKTIYDNPDIMDYHMHGLILGQFLWPDQYTRFKFFADNLLQYKPIKRYLEVGGGHGLYVAEAVKLLGDKTEFEIIDISKSSLNICRNMVKGARVNFVLKDIFEYRLSEKFDFITAGEIIEHLEEPLKLLNKIREMLDDAGTIYLTTPVNAPMIDHIFLFNNIEEIRQLVSKAGFRIVQEVQEYAHSMPEDQAIKYKISLMYACFLKKS